MKAAEKVVSYYYDEEIGNYCLGLGNPMRPHRARLVYSLNDAYNLNSRMMVHRPRPQTFEELTMFHADEYIDFLRTVVPENATEYSAQLSRFKMGMPGRGDCPVFDGMWDYFQLYTGGSVDGAAQLASGTADIAVNWSGGMHHAKRAEASGFCFVNDIVLAILELLKTYARVLYVDIDIHHGDGVEEAFYLTDRVMTVSFHKYGEFFPGTGALHDTGYGRGANYTVNVPLKDGMDDESYRSLYEPIMQKVMELYQPGAIVMCCGADSLSGDRLGCFNLSLEGHSASIEFLKKFNVPMLILGGGGYTLRNVARCWCYETGRLLGVDLPDELPDKALDEFNMYMDTQRLRIAVSNMENRNDKGELEAIKTAVLQHLSRLPAAPGAAMAIVPPALGRERPELGEEDPDERGGGRAYEEARRVCDGDESDEEGGSGRGGYMEDAPARAATEPAHFRCHPVAAAAARGWAQGEAAARAGEPGPAEGREQQGPEGMQVEMAGPSRRPGSNGSGPVAPMAHPAQLNGHWVTPSPSPQPELEALPPQAEARQASPRPQAPAHAARVSPAHKALQEEQLQQQIQHFSQLPQGPQPGAEDVPAWLANARGLSSAVAAAAAAVNANAGNVLPRLQQTA